MSEPTQPTVLVVKTWDRCFKVMRDQLDADSLATLSADGWKLDPIIQTVKLDNAAIYCLFKGDSTAEGANPSIETTEVLDGFMSIAPDDRPDGPLAHYLADGWVYVGFTGTKNLVQLKKPRAKTVTPLG